MNPHSTADERSTSLEQARIPTPLGVMFARFSPSGVTELRFASPDDDRPPQLEARETKAHLYGEDAALSELVHAEIAAYFAGSLREFTVPLDMQGTDFQRKVWRLLCTIEYGRTMSYSDLAHLLGDPRSIRAVARANAQNPIAVIVPCHRVVGSDGSLTGYAGGLWRKRRLLLLESTGLIGEPQSDLFKVS